MVPYADVVADATAVLVPEVSLAAGVDAVDEACAVSLVVVS